MMQNEPAASAGRFRFRWALAVLLAGATLAALLVRDLPAQQPTGLQTAAALEQAMVQAIARCERSVVAIARGRRGEAGFRLTDPDFVPSEYGTGVVVDRGGLILTNYHVLGDPEASEYAVWVDRRPFPAKVRAADPWSDLAVLEIDATDLAPMPLGSGKNARKGQIVIALGNPYAIARDGSPSATWGIVSNLSRKAPPTPTRDAPSGKETLHHFGTLIQTDARLSLGTSGGALLNLDGEMIGLTTSMAALSGLEKSAGFAIPVDDLFRRVVDRLKQGRDVEYGFLGIEPEPLGLRELQRGEHGIRLGEVVNGTPAATAGLKRDDVVTHVDSQPVFDGDHLILLLSSRPVDETVRLTLQRFDPVLRRPRTRHKDVELSKKHVAANRAAIVSVQPPLWRGLTVDYATAVPRFHLLARQKVDGQWVVDPQGCVAVVDVAPQSTAWEAGIRPGLFVSHVQGQRVVKPAEFQAAVAQRDGPVELTFTSPVGQHRDVELAP